MRFNILSMIHKSLRMSLSESLFEIQKLDLEDKDHLKSTFQNMDTCLELLHFHAEMEDSLIFPLLMETNHQLVESLEEEHIADAELILKIKTLSELILKANENDFNQYKDQLIITFSRLLAFNLEHMAKEEMILVPLLWEYYSDQYLREISGSIAAKNPDHLRASGMDLFIKACDAKELKTWFNSIPDISPVKPMIKNRAEALLPESRWNKIFA